MAEPKTRPTDASVEAFLDAVTPAVRRTDGLTLLEMMQEVTGAPAVMWGTGIVGFGSRASTYASGAEIDWPVVAFSPRKASLSIYLMDGFDRYQDLLDGLGKHSTGKGCLYVKKLADVDEAVLRAIIERAWSG